MLATTAHVAGILGAGVTYHASSRWGIRLDACVSLSKNTTSTVLDTNSNVGLGQLQAGRSIYSANPTIQCQRCCSLSEIVA